MAMKHVRAGEVDTPDEVAKALNRIIDNANLTEAKVEQLAIPKPVKGPDKKPKKGTVMSKTIVGLILVFVLLFTSTVAADITVTNIREQTVRPERDLAILLRKKFSQHNLDIASAGFNKGTGRVFYVDSNAGGSATSTGTTPASAWPTLDDAFDTGHVSANRGDIVYVMQGHQEVLASSGNIFDMDIAGVTVIGISNGGRSGPVAAGAATLNFMPVFILDHASATATISAPNCRISGVKFESDVIDNAIGLTITAAADGYVVDNCMFRDGAAAEEMVIAINVVADADDGIIANNTFSTFPSGGCANAIVLAGGSDNSIISGNIANGTYSAGAFLATAAASVNLTVVNNIFCNQGAIAFDGHTSTTGILAGNYLAGTTSIAAALTDIDAMWPFENYVTGEDNKSGLLDPTADDV